MKKVFLIGIIAFCVLSCKNEQISQPVPQAPYELWQARNLHNYSIDQRRTCYCPHGGETVRITVRSDTIFSVVRISDTTAVSYPFYLTVDSLFGLIGNLKNDSLVVTYNAVYGYPEYVFDNPQLQAIDGGFLYETSNLQIVAVSTTRQ